MEVSIVNVYGISDLHLPGGEDKPMDIFGSHWQNHSERIEQAWQEIVKDEDLVLSPGDLSWAMDLSGAKSDLDFLGRLSGTTLIGKGNHDFWWQSISQLRKQLPPGVYALQNDFYPLPDDKAVCGTRGWKCPTADDFTKDDERVYLREIERLKLSLEAAAKDNREPYIVMLHYPPIDINRVPSGFTELMEAVGVVHCVYGHLHGHAHRQALQGLHNGIEYHLVACDAIGFKPKLIANLSNQS